MIFQYIKIKNFCPYYDEQTIHFATDNYCNVTVIRGVNGTGKTSLLNALNWCLYGDSFFKGNTREFVNRRVVAQAENVDTSVEIGILDQDIRYRIVRKCRSLRNDRATLSLQRENEPPDLNAAASDKIRSMIPEDVSAHFFFDGEKIDNFARPGNEDEIKSAVRNVLRIELFERGITHLENAAKEYQTRLKRYVPEKLKEFINEREENEELCLKETKNVEEKLKQIRIAKKHKHDIDKLLQEYEETRKLFEEQRELTIDLNGHRNEQERSQVRIRELANDGYIPLAKPIIKKALKILQSSKTQTSIPDTILNEILEQMRCLCGRSIDRESPEFKHIQKLLSQSISQEFGIASRELEHNLERLLANKIEDIPTNVESALRSEKQIEKEIEAKEARLEEIRRILQNFDDDVFQEHKNAQEKYIGEIRFLEGEIKQIRERIRGIKTDIKTLDKKIAREKSLKVDAEHLRRCRHLAMESAASMKKLYEPHEEIIRKDLEIEVSEIFKKLIWKENSFREVRISLDYELQVIDRYDGQVSSEISAGEREVLSLAFIAALAKVAVKEKLPDIPAERFPIVMDAPFTKLSDKPKENITENIPIIANQLILFITDQELRPDEQAWQNIKPRIGTEYELHFDDEISVTTIKRIK